MGMNRGAALSAFAELGGMPAVRGLAGAKAHLGHLAFWNSHIGII